MRGKSILRQAFNFRLTSSSSSRFSLNHKYLISSRNKNSPIAGILFSVSTPQNFTPSRTFSDYSSMSGFRPASLPDPDTMDFVPSFAQVEVAPVPENIVKVDTEEGFNAALTKAESESQQSVFYFTASWCAPCRFVGPVIEELCRRAPQVTTYKMDIDEVGLKSKLEELNISSVPTVHFFKEGKKEVEVVGADVTRIVQSMNNLYELKQVEPEEKEEPPKMDPEEQKIVAEELRKFLENMTSKRDSKEDSKDDSKEQKNEN